MRVIVAGGGLAGLTAARRLEADGAEVTVIEARDRVGGRVHTLRRGFAEGQHVEAGADLIEEEHSAVIELARELRLDPVRILRRGWGFYGEDAHGRRQIRKAHDTFEQVARRLAPEIADYKAARQRWDSPVATVIARQSVADWLARTGGDAGLAAGLKGLRGFFLADPEDLSLIALVDQFASGETPGDTRMYRIEGGNDSLPRALAASLRGAVMLGSIVRRVSGRGDRIAVAVEQHGTTGEVAGDYLVCALPATTLRDIEFAPPLPDMQQRAIASLKYGTATRVALQFDRRFWRKAAQPSAFGTDGPYGAVWDGNEEQRGRGGILTLLAGGRASHETQEILRAEGWNGLVRRMAWLDGAAAMTRGAPDARLVHAISVTWEDEPWSRGGYAVCDPAFDPALREWLSRAAGRIVFAGEHTSFESQGYMNGAVESGIRAAVEVRALASPDAR